MRWIIALLCCLSLVGCGGRTNGSIPVLSVDTTIPAHTMGTWHLVIPRSSHLTGQISAPDGPLLTSLSRPDGSTYWPTVRVTNVVTVDLQDVAAGIYTLRIQNPTSVPHHVAVDLVISASAH